MNYLLITFQRPFVYFVQKIIWQFSVVVSHVIYPEKSMHTKFISRTLDTDSFQINKPQNKILSDFIQRTDEASSSRRLKHNLLHFSPERIPVFAVSEN